MGIRVSTDMEGRSFCFNSTNDALLGRLFYDNENDPTKDSKSQALGFLQFLQDKGVNPATLTILEWDNFLSEFEFNS